ncbi:MAG: hypothetical protein VB064_11650 [Oscillospiraceae bacterium]|nr:hypothetical protein [Oscillospiraceae bacterium]
MKKIVSLACAIIMIFALSINCFAATKYSSITEAQANNGLYVSGNSVYDFTKASSKTFVPGRTDGSYSVNSTGTERYFSADSTYHSFTCVFRSTSDAYSNYGSDSWVIDKIEAKCRYYQDDALAASGIDTEYNASHAGATPSPMPTLLSSSDYIYGSHAFEEAGYQSWYPETYEAYSMF